MRLHPAGSFGIGTSSPNAKLHVVGSTRLDGNTFIGSAVADMHTITGNITASGVNISASSVPNLEAEGESYGGTIIANTFVGTLTTAAQPNITSVGTLTSITSTGNSTLGNAAIHLQVI